MTKAKLSQLRNAYQRIFPEEHFDEKKAISMVEKVVYHPDAYPFEDKDLLSKRLVIITSIDDTNKITEYLATIPDDKMVFEQTTCYGRVLEIYNKFLNPAKPPLETAPAATEENSGSNISEVHSSSGVEELKEDGMPEQDTTPITSPSPELHDADTSINNNNKIKEEKRMSENAIENLRKEAGEMGVGTELNNTNVTLASKADLAAAAAIVNETKNDRQSFSKNAVIEKVLVTAIDREKKAVKGRAAMGRVSDPQKALKKFREVTGFTEKDGQIEFTRKAPSETYDNMMRMYNVLQEAVKDPNYEVTPYFGKEGAETPVSLKAYQLKTPEGKRERILNSEIAELLINRTFMYLNIAGNSHGQIQLDRAKPRAGQAPKKTHVVRVANRKEVLADAGVVVAVKEITDKVSDQKTGFKSDLVVYCLGTNVDAKGEPRKIAYRIPLEVEQYEVTIIDEYKDLFKSSGVGSSVAPINPDDEKDAAEIMNRIQSILAAEMTLDPKNSIIDPDLAAKANEVKEDIAAKSASAVEEMLGDSGSEADFD